MGTNFNVDPNGDLSIVNHIQQLGTGFHLTVMSGGTITLTNPCPNYIEIEGTGGTLRFPPMNASNSLSIKNNTFIFLFCQTSGSVVIQTNTGVSTYATMTSGQSWIFYPIDNSSADGHFIGANVTSLISATTPLSLSSSGVLSLNTNGVTNTFLAQMAAHTFKGNNTGSTANPIDLTKLQMQDELDVGDPLTRDTFTSLDYDMEDPTDNCSFAGNIGGGVASFANTMFANGSQIAFGSGSFPGSALVAMNSTTKGFQPPKMTTTQKNSISSPVSGLTVYDTTLNVISTYNGTSWTTSSNTPIPNTQVAFGNSTSTDITSSSNFTYNSSGQLTLTDQGDGSVFILNNQNSSAVAHQMVLQKNGTNSVFLGNNNATNQTYLYSASSVLKFGTNSAEVARFTNGNFQVGADFVWDNTGKQLILENSTSQVNAGLLLPNPDTTPTPLNTYSSPNLFVVVASGPWSDRTVTLGFTRIGAMVFMQWEDIASAAITSGPAKISISAAVPPAFRPAHNVTYSIKIYYGVSGTDVAQGDLYINSSTGDILITNNNFSDFVAGFAGWPESCVCWRVG